MKRDHFCRLRGREKDEHSFSCPTLHLKIMAIYYWALQLYSNTWNVKNKLAICISKIYFGDSPDKAASQLTVNAKQENAGENTV